MAAQGVSAANTGGIYATPNLRIVNHQVPGTAYLKGGWLRSPLDLSVSFASEQAIDELAYLLNMDPYEFRKRNITDDALDGSARRGGEGGELDAPARGFPKSDAKIVTGRGIGLGTHLVSYGGAVAEIEVNKETGRVVAKHMYGAHRRGAHGESCVRREPDQRTTGADRQPDVQGRSDVQHHQCHQSRLEQLSDSAVSKSVPRSRRWWCSAWIKGRPARAKK